MIQQAPTPQTHPSLFGRTTQQRLLANAEAPGFHYEWTYGNQGAANAWVVLVGPSPGHEKRSTVPPTNVVAFGARAQFIGMHGFRNRAWDALITASFGNQLTPGARDQLVALINFTGVNETSETNVPAQALDDGADEVCRKISAMHPRVVVALSNAVFDRLQQKLPTEPVESSGQPLGPHSVPLRVTSFKDHETGARTLLIKPPQHPSRPMKRPQHLAESVSASELKTFGVRETVDWFFATNL